MSFNLFQKSYVIKRLRFVIMKVIQQSMSASESDSKRSPKCILYPVHFEPLKATTSKKARLICMCKIWLVGSRLVILLYVSEFKYVLV